MTVRSPSAPCWPDDNHRTAQGFASSVRPASGLTRLTFPSEVVSSTSTAFQAMSPRWVTGIHQLKDVSMFRNGSRVWGVLALALVATMALTGSPAPASAAGTGPRALWDTTVTPPCLAVAGDPCGIVDTNGVELGVKFQTSQPISIVG